MDLFAVSANNFDHNEDRVRELQEELSAVKQQLAQVQAVAHAVQKIDADALTPRQAHQALYQLQDLVA
jgi:type II secretory pathway component PulM